MLSHLFRAALLFRANKYRYNYQGYNIGGQSTFPVISIRTSRSCFSSSARNGSVNWFPIGQHNVTVPTPAERMGDFSATHDGSGVPVKSLTPQPGLQFMGNGIRT